LVPALGIEHLAQLPDARMNLQVLSDLNLIVAGPNRIVRIILLGLPKLEIGDLVKK